MKQLNDISYILLAGSELAYVVVSLALALRGITLKSSGNLQQQWFDRLR